MIKVEMCFDVDLPTSLEEALKDAYRPSNFGHVAIYRTTARKLAEDLPRFHPWLARNGYLNPDWPVIITRTPDDVKVEKPVAQQG